MITSDHGEQFGEHQLLEHSNSLYLPLLQVPLIISFPGRVPPAYRIEESISLRNLPATIADLVGLQVAAPFPGYSLSSYWQDSSASLPDELVLAEAQQTHPAYPDWYPARKGYMQALIRGELHYIINYGEDREEFYNFGRDPEEEQNLLTTEDGRAVAGRLRAHLNDLTSKP